MSTHEISVRKSQELATMIQKLVVFETVFKAVIRANLFTKLHNLVLPIAV